MWNDKLKKIKESYVPDQAIKRWDGKINSLRLVNEGINFVYRFERHHHGFYLRLTHSELRSENELLAAIYYQEHLFKNAVPVCEPITSNNAHFIERIEHNDDVFLAHVCREVPGNPITFNIDNSSLYMQWGAALAKLHLAAETFHHDKYHYSAWFESIDEMVGYVINESKLIKKSLDEVSNHFKNKRSDHNNYGLTHGDHRKGNVLTDGKAIHIIDYDLPRFNWFMEDIARPFFSSIVWDEQNWQDKLLPYLNGYQAVKKIADEDINDMAWFLRMKALEIYLWTKHNWNAESAPGGMNTLAWLEAIYKKILDTSWIKQINTLLEKR